MKKVILFLFFLPIFLQAQELTFDSTAVIKIDTFYYLETHQYYDNGNFLIDRQLIGDSTKFLNYLFNNIEQSQRLKARSDKASFENRNLGENNDILKSLTGFNYYRNAADILDEVFIGDCKVRINGTAYDGIISNSGIHLNIDITNVGNYTIHIGSRQSFIIKDFWGEGIDAELFLLSEYGVKRVFVNYDNTVRVIFN
jgi:hypothetical protein